MKKTLRLRAFCDGQKVEAGGATGKSLRLCVKGAALSAALDNTVDEKTLRLRALCDGQKGKEGKFEQRACDAERSSRDPFWL